MILKKICKCCNNKFETKFKIQKYCVNCNDINKRRYFKVKRKKTKLKKCWWIDYDNVTYKVKDRSIYDFGYKVLIKH